MKISALLFLFLLFVNSLFAENGNFPTTRPDIQKGATDVHISLYVMDIENINNKLQSFTLDVIIRYRWKDSRLKGVEGQYPINSVWYPNIQLSNLRDSETRFPKVVVIKKDGTVEYTQRYYATLRTFLDFKNFPFDTQTLPITFFAFGVTPEEVNFVFEKAGSEEKFSISDWEIEPVGASISTIRANVFNDSDTEIIRPRLDYTFKATRYVHFYLWKVLAPMLVILFLSWAVFWIDPSQVGAQIGVSGTSILSLIAFLYKLDNILPPVSYLTRMDNFIFTALILVFLAYLEALISTTFALKGKKEFALKLDFTFRVVYPFLFLIVLYVFWVK